MFKIVFYRSLFTQSAASLTVGYLTQYIRDNGYKAKVELLEQGRIDNMEKIISDRAEYPVIIYKCNFQDYVEGCELLATVKEISPNMQIYVMGYFSEINAQSFITRFDYIDGIIFGDGCIFAKKFAESHGQKRVGGVFRDKNKNIVWDNEIRYVSLKELSEPARDIEKKEIGEYINIVWKNGCFGTCSYCHINLIKRPYSERSVDSVVREMEKCYKEMNKRMFIFNDSVFWWGKRDDKKLDRFIALLEEKKMDINFMVYLRCDPFIGEDMLRRLKKVGLCRIFIGVENISDKFFDKYGKKVTGCDEILKVFNKFNISYHIGFILFHPSVTCGELKTNIEYLYKLDKLYRIGIIIEKMRLLRRRDEKEPDDKIDIAYDYRFEDERVEKIFNVLKCFYNDINIRGFENTCTSALFLMNLYGNKYNDWNSDAFCRFRKLIHEYNFFARRFLFETIDLSVSLNEKEMIKKVNRKYKKNMMAYYYKLQAERANVYDFVGKHDSQLKKRVFHGERRLNAYD